MSSFCCEFLKKECHQLGLYLFQELGLVKRKFSRVDIDRMIQEQAKKHLALDRTQFWGEFLQQPSEIRPMLYKALSLFNQEGLPPGVAVELGCGNSMASIEMLTRGWKVIAVDYSPDVLERFKELANSIDPVWITSGQLEIVCKSMEDFEFPDNIQMVFAQDSLAFCHPEKIRNLFERIFQSLSEGGRFVGNVVPTPDNRALEMIYRSMFGASYADMPIVKNLLKDSGFSKELLQRTASAIGSKWIEFIGVKSKIATDPYEIEKRSVNG